MWQQLVDRRIERKVHRLLPLHPILRHRGTSSARNQETLLLPLLLLLLPPPQLWLLLPPELRLRRRHCLWEMTKRMMMHPQARRRKGPWATKQQMELVPAAAFCPRRLGSQEQWQLCRKEGDRKSVV